MCCDPSRTLQRLRIGSQNQHRVLFVLDASESASDHRDEIVRIARETVGRLGGPRGCEVAFLGSSTRYPVEILESPLNELFREHERRASLLSPVMHGFDDQPYRLAIIGSGQVFDLSDWLHDSQVASPLLYSVADLLSDLEQQRGFTVQSPAALADALDPVYSSIEVTGRNFVPIDWGCDAELQIRDGKLVLVVSNLDGSVEILVDSESASSLIASGRTRNGRQVRLTVTYESAATLPVEDIPLNNSETKVLASILQGKPFECPYCGMEHAGHETSCNQDDHPKYRFRGRPLLPSLAGRPRSDWIVCELCDGQVSCRAIRNRVLRLSPTALLARSSGRITKFEEQAGVWKQAVIEVRPVIRVSGGVYVADIS